MQTRQLGCSNITVSAIGLGCMGMSEFYGAADRKQSIAVIHEALNLDSFFSSITLEMMTKDEIDMTHEMARMAERA